MNDEVKFARSLAHPEKSVRDKTLKTLQQYLANVTALPDLEMAQLWKALYYCMWLCDKTQIQMELADSLSSLIGVFSKYSLSLKYLRCFFRILLREWTQLDQYRINKFYSLIRLVLRKSFAMLQEKGLKFKQIDQFLEVLQEEVLCKTPNGIRFHLCDIYLEEMYGVFGAALSRKVFFQLLQPYLTSLANADDPIYHERITKKIALGFIDLIAEKPWKYVSALHMQEVVFSIASDENTNNRYRKRVYDIHAAYQQHTGQQYAPISTNDDVVEDVTVTTSEESNEKQKNKKKRVVEEPAEDTTITNAAEPKKKKSKTKAVESAPPTTEESAPSTMTSDAAPEGATAKKKKTKVVEPEPTLSSPTAPSTPPAPVKETEAPAFISSKKFAGAKPGYVFKQGPSGLGYYKDTKGTASKSLRFDKVYKKSHAVSVRDLKSATLDLSKKPTKSAIKATSSISASANGQSASGKKHGKKR